MDRPVDFTSVLGLVYKDVALRLGLMSTRPTALALMSQQHEVVHVVLNKLLKVRPTMGGNVPLAEISRRFNL